MSALWAGDAVLSLYLGLRLLLLAAVYLAVVNLRPPAWVAQVGIALSLGIQVAVAALQFAHRGALGWGWLGEIPLEVVLGQALQAGSWVRAAGLTPHPNILGGLMGVGGLALMPAFLRTKSKSRLAWLLALLLCGVGLILPLSRGALLGTAVGGGFLLLALLRHPNWRAPFGRIATSAFGAALLLAVGAALWRPRLLWQRLMDWQPWQTRAILNQVALQLIAQSPWLGVGVGNFSIAGIAGIGLATLPQPVHNVPLLLLAELGPLGGGLWLWLTLLPPLWTARRIFQGRASLWETGLAAGLLALVIIDLFDFYSWGWQQGRLWRWLWLALWVNAMQEPAQPDRPRRDGETGGTPLSAPTV